MSSNDDCSDGALHAAALAAGDALKRRGLVLATAESCTGGWIAKLVTDIPGSSDWFWGSAVTYSNRAKELLLGVAAATLDRHGAVSRACALEMVAGVIDRFGVGMAVAVTGIAGPGGATPGKPVGTVWIAWQRHGDAGRAEVFHFAGDRDAVRRQTAAAALAGIRKSLTA